ncbi:MAG: ABC transporter permease, partial [Burkholderiales bacterium]
MKLSILWTDWLIYLLVAATCVFIFVVRRHEHLRAPWRKVFHDTTGIVSLTVLSIFVIVGLLDSVHFRPRIATLEGQPAQYSVEALSVLDWMVTPLRTQFEKTYSAPFATHSYAKETLTLPDGREAREFPRLRHGGAHLADPQSDRWPDVGRRISLATAIAIVIWISLMAALTWFLARRKDLSFNESLHGLWHGETEVPWRAVLITVAVLLLLIVPAALLGPYYHILGTGKVGQDVFYQALKSIRTGLVIGTLTTLIMLPFALLLGIMAGYFRGWIDDVIQYLYTVLNSIPGVLLIAAAVLMTQVYMDTHPELFPTINERADLRLLFLCIILGITSWTGLCRLLRGETLKLREMEYIQSAHALGVSDFRILVRHILPNVMHIVLIAIVLDFSGLVLAEAVLSYVGVGVDPSMISFGTMINSARLEMAREPMVWWSLAAAFA